MKEMQSDECNVLNSMWWIDYMQWMQYKEYNNESDILI